MGLSVLHQVRKCIQNFGTCGSQIYSKIVDSLWSKPWTFKVHLLSLYLYIDLRFLLSVTDRQTFYHDRKIAIREIVYMTILLLSPDFHQNKPMSFVKLKVYV